MGAAPAQRRCYAYMSAGEGALMVFAKAPIPGQVKTRLVAVLGPNGATACHRALVRCSLALARRSTVAQVELWCSPDSKHDFFRCCQSRYAVSLHDQQGTDLGARMQHAFKQTLGKAGFALLMGSDCPSLTVSDLDRARQALKDGYDAVIGPALDGGYVLMGLRQGEPSLFSEIPWGTAAVVQLTRERMRRLRWRWYELPVRWDVDRPEDLHRLRDIQEPEVSAFA